MRRAFTLVELLVVIAIIGILVALLLPAVQAAREAARRTQCKNNLKNIALAMQNHLSTHSVFPTGGATFGEPAEWYMVGNKPFGPKKQGMSWAFQILPFIEAGNIQGQGNTLQLQASPMPMFNCPSRRPPTLYQSQFYGPGYLMDYAASHPATRLSATLATLVDPVRDGEVHQRMYAAFWATRAGGWNGSGPPNNGVYDGVIVRSPWRVSISKPSSLASVQSNAPGEFATGVPGPVRPAKITDGLSNTMMIGEKWVYGEEYEGGGPSDDRGWLDGWDPDTVRLTSTPPAPDGTFPPLMQNSQSKGQDNQAYLFGAAHSSVFNAAFADGSVRSIGYDIDMYVFNSAGTRNGEAFKETSSTEGMD
ncbi:DUF1559 family PulG-like putative transporter [Aeoliella sp. SH292]|uniref:DUF1559 family PulG-like putative transporter n=1 Tax=Aeoliella sp. SH292 TaxID=3454464 RepID=UPI003F9B39CC